jgi:uncharacterized alpha-E superfamily protein
VLSRIATHLYGLGRNLERADHLSRLTNQHLTLWLDRAGGRRPDFWEGVMLVAGWPPEVARGPARAQALVIGVKGPSVRESIRSARRHAQSVRPSLSSEVYEQVNTLYLRLDSADWGRDIHDVLGEVQLGVHLIDGLIEESMVHDEPWDFLRLGKRLERAANVTRLVTLKLQQLEGEEDPAEWASVLRSCSAFEAYRGRFAAPVTPSRLVAFLLLDRNLPRSALYCVREAVDSVVRIDGAAGRSRPHRLLGQLSAHFEYSEENEVAAAPADFAVAFGRLARGIHDALQTTYFQPSVVARDQAPSPPAAAESQQQQ